MVKIAVVVYSTYGHVLALAQSEIEGLRAAGAEVELYQFPSEEPNDASAKENLLVITPEILATYDGFLFGIPSRFGTHPYAFKAFFDSTGAQWVQGSFFGKYAGLFVSSGSQGGGQEGVIRNTVTTLTHHGILFVPLGYKNAFSELTNLEVVHGGSPWGAGTLAGATGARLPSETELKVAFIQGQTFAETVIRSQTVEAYTADHLNLNSADADGATANNTVAIADASHQAHVNATSAYDEKFLQSESFVDASSSPQTPVGAQQSTEAAVGETAAAATANAEVPNVASDAAEIKKEASKQVPSPNQKKVDDPALATGPVTAVGPKPENTLDEPNAAKAAAAKPKSAPAKTEAPATTSTAAAAATKKEKDGCCKCM